MLYSDNADASSQGEGHILARMGGHKFCLRISAANEKNAMNGITLIRLVMIPQANHRE